MDDRPVAMKMMIGEKMINQPMNDDVDFITSVILYEAHGIRNVTQ